jgi:hypothetical protein
MANLKAAAAKIEQRTKAKLARGAVSLPLPIFEGQYGARYGVVSEEAMDRFEKIAEKAEVTRHEAVEVAAEFIADACRTILARTGPDDPWEALQHDDGRPVRFDEDFVEALGLEPAEGEYAPEGGVIASDVDAVLAVFVTDTGELNTAALNQHAGRLLTWMQNTEAPVIGELVEGPQGGPR